MWMHFCLTFVSFIWEPLLIVVIVVVVISLFIKISYGDVLNSEPLFLYPENLYPPCYLAIGNSDLLTAKCER